MKFIELKERVALCKDFTSDERALILDALNLSNDRSTKHEYPKNYGPGSSTWATHAWGILDQFRPNAFAKNDRYMLGGMIAGALKEMFDQGRLSRK